MNQKQRDPKPINQSWDEWYASLRGDAFRDSDAVSPEGGISVASKRISTSRDDYGWRSLKGGTHYLGSNKT